MIDSTVHNIALSIPLFLLIVLGYGLVRVFRWPESAAAVLTKLVFNVLVTALLFRTMADFSSLPPVDPSLLIAYFGGCFVVFAAGRVVSRTVFGHDGVSQAIFGVGGVFANTVFLGIPLAKLTLGEAAIPSVSLVITMNALILWTLVTVSSEWALHGSLTPKGFAKTLRSVFTNPIILSLMAGLCFDATGLHLPPVIDSPVAMLAQAAAPMSLVALGMGMAKFGIGAGWRQGLALAGMKLVLHPLAVFLLARWLHLPSRETQAVVMLASVAVGFNVYLMANQFGKLEGAVASGIVFSTALAAITTPIAISLTQSFG